MESKMPSMRSGLWTGMFRPCGVTLLRATELLHEAGIPVCEIAERVGYAKPSQFSADFRKRFGVLPREYRTS